MNPYIDRLLTTEPEDQLALRSLEFDLALVVDKSLRAIGVTRLSSVAEIRGFKANSTGAIVPANEAARELWELGLNDKKKFFENEKPETQLLVEAMELGPYHRDEYVLRLTDSERDRALLRRKQWAPLGQTLIGINTGSSATIPHKKWPVQYQRNLVRALEKEIDCSIVLLGGREDTVRNQQIAAGSRAVLSPTEAGLRDGMCSMAACDLVITGDSLGLHMAVGLKRWVVAWFGPTCAHEIDLYGRGEKLQAEVSCGPCWKRACDKSPLCNEMVPLSSVVSAVKKEIELRVDYGPATPYGPRYESKPGHSNGFSWGSSSQHSADKEA